ncbi:MAG: rhomboid family intramembrane serine protease [Spirochaetaceae bacterium]|nr:MAG: rhomboid family intramembrane serine protease [Spirochaetaceae bacterium]
MNRSGIARGDRGPGRVACIFVDMIPSREYRTSKSFPWVNIGLVVVNLIVFLYIRFGLDTAGAGYAEFQYSFTSELFFLEFARSWFTPVTALFLHTGWFPFLANTLFLLIVGDNVEDALGHVKYLVFFLVAGVFVNFASAFFAAVVGVPISGSSGAVSAVIAAYMVLYPLQKAVTFVPISFFLMPIRSPAFVFLGIWAVVQTVQLTLGIPSGGVSSVGFVAHAAALVLGALFVLSSRARYVKKFRYYRPALTRPRPQRIKRARAV